MRDARMAARRRAMLEAAEALVGADERARLDMLELWYWRGRADGLDRAKTILRTKRTKRPKKAVLTLRRRDARWLENELQ